MGQSYKIFINDKPLIIAANDFIPDGDEYVIPEKEFRSHIKDSAEWLLDHHFGEKALVMTESAHDLVEETRQALKNVTAAGGLVTNPQDDLLMIFRRGKWDLPKGKLEPGEVVEYAALREVYEETGVQNLEITGKLKTTWHIYKEHGELIIKDTHWYHMACREPALLTPQAQEGITEAEWVAKQDIPLKMTNSFKSIRELLMGS